MNISSFVCLGGVNERILARAAAHGARGQQRASQPLARVSPDTCQPARSCEKRLKLRFVGRPSRSREPCLRHSRAPACSMANGRGVRARVRAAAGARARVRAGARLRLRARVGRAIGFLGAARAARRHNPAARRRHQRAAAARAVVAACRHALGPTP
eukprot:scaffold63834_cov36-Phaeocystis_antarctica.AAC.1